MRIIVAILALLAMLSTPVLADRRTAEDHKAKARALEQRKAYDEAIEEYKAAYDAGGGPGPLYNIARIYEDSKGDLRQAIVYYERFLDVDRDHAAENGAIRAVLENARLRVAAEDEQHRKQEEVHRAEARKRAAASEVEQAEEYAQAGSWAASAEHHTSAFELDGDREHLRAAAAAYRRQLDLPRARAAYQRYIDVAPVGPGSETARAAIADIARELARAEQDERDRKIAAIVRRTDEPPPSRHRVSPTWLAVGGVLVGAGLVADTVPASGKNGKLDTTDFAGPVLYTVGAAVIVAGLFWR
jgi:tetratricopeptide (TPR) repeat protein